MPMFAGRARILAEAREESARSIGERLGGERELGDRGRGDGESSAAGCGLEALACSASTCHVRGEEVGSAEDEFGARRAILAREPGAVEGVSHGELAVTLDDTEA